MGDKDPKSIEKLKGQAEGSKEEALDYKHETPARKQQANEREDAIDEAKIGQQYGEELEPVEG